MGTLEQRSTRSSAREDLSALRREVRRRGYYDGATARVVAELALHVALAFGGGLLAAFAPSIAAKVAGVVVSALGTFGVATNTHTSSHFAAGPRKRLNDALLFFGYPLFCQISATYWRWNHVVVHHASPNVVGVDPDADLSPWFTHTVPEGGGGGFARRAYHRVQGLFFPLAIAAAAFHFQYSGWRHLLRALRDPARRRRAHALDLALMIAHFGLWIALPAVFFPLGPVLAFHVARFVLVGVLIFLVIMPGHFPPEAATVARAAREPDFVLRQTATTVNFRPGLFGLFCSGLEYQIEHHLFPGMSHAHLPAVSAEVRRFCARHGYPYRSFGWAEAVGKSLVFLVRPKPVRPSFAGLRYADQPSKGEGSASPERAPAVGAPATVARVARA